MLNKRILVLMFVVAFLFVGCLPGITPPITPVIENQAPTITSTAITTATVGVAYTYDVNATDPDGDTLTYSLDTKPSGMTINSVNGLIKWTPTAKGDYSVVVKVSDGDLDITQSFTITVIEEEPVLIEIKVVPKTMDLFERESETITSVTAHYSDGSTVNIALKNCSYESSHKEQVTVTNTGLITAVARPSATITVSYTEKGITKTDKIIVEVKFVGLDHIVVLPKTMYLIVGDTGNIISVTAHYVDGFETNIPLGDDYCKYISSNKDVVTVDTGLVTAVAEGIATVTVSYFGKSDILEITVTDPITEPVPLGTPLTKDGITVTVEKIDQVEWPLCPEAFFGLETYFTVINSSERILKSGRLGPATGSLFYVLDEGIYEDEFNSIGYNHIGDATSWVYPGQSRSVGYRKCFHSPVTIKQITWTGTFADDQTEIELGPWKN